ncbi:MAG TPA: thermonuclease family protein [Patescibacteria group bacterium]|nr:thermonuclease family protein [Patescibacteria group bacterium]
MKRIGWYSLLVILLASLGLNGYFLNKQRDESLVVSVHDGDTFTLANGDRIKLIGVDAPELDNCMGKEAQEYLRSMVLHKRIFISEDKCDTYGRRMGLVWLGPGSVNHQVIMNGYARPDYTPNSISDSLKSAYAHAKQAELGIHSPTCKKISPTPPNKKCVIKGNIDKATGDHFYHLPTCRHYNQIVLDEDMGEGFFCSEKEAQAEGFRLAPDCLR